MTYGKQFETATEEEVRRLLELADEGLIHAWEWLVEWVTTDKHQTIHDPRIEQNGMLTTPDTVLAYFEDTAGTRRKAMKESGS